MNEQMCEYSNADIPSITTKMRSPEEPKNQMYPNHRVFIFSVQYHVDLTINRMSNEPRDAY